MDLKIKDVSELLSISEDTIRNWVLNGEIPAYKLNDEYRFNRIEIENWMREKTFSQSSHTGTRQFSLYRAIHQGGVFEVEGSTKQEVIEASCSFIAPKLGMDSDVISELLMDREKLMSTALNDGIAVPHPRELLQGRSLDQVVVAFLKKPIDFEALDGKKVHTLFYLFSSDDKKHLRLLAKIAHFSRAEGALELLREKPSKERLLAFIKKWES